MDQSIGRMCIRDVVTVSADTAVAQAAALMRKNHIGAVVMAESRGSGKVPVGILTDRDIVVEVVAPGLDPNTITVGEIVQRRVATIAGDASCAQVAREMSNSGVRRLPVVNSDGTLRGIVSLDDVLLELVAPLLAVGDLAGRERRLEEHTRRE